MPTFVFNGELRSGLKNASPKGRSQDPRTDERESANLEYSGVSLGSPSESVVRKGLTNSLDSLRTRGVESSRKIDRLFALRQRQLRRTPKVSTARTVKPDGAGVIQVNSSVSSNLAFRLKRK